jgi:hypothetical protein
MVKDMGGKKVERTYPPGHDPVTKLRDTFQRQMTERLWSFTLRELNKKL